jgi:hypothetical protein
MSKYALFGVIMPTSRLLHHPSIISRSRRRLAANEIYGNPVSNSNRHRATAQTSAINFAYYATRARGRMAHAVEEARLLAAQKISFFLRDDLCAGRFQANVHGSLT